MLMTFYILQVPVDLVTSIGLSVAVGLAGDNAVQYLLSGKNSNLKSGLIKKARASFLANFLMVLLCVPFFFSDFSTPRWLGIILIVGFVMSYIGDFWVLKGLIKDDQNGHS